MDGKLTAEFVMPHTRGNFVFVIVPAGRQQKELLKGTLALDSNDGAPISFHFCAVDRNPDLNAAGDDVIRYQLQPDSSSNARIEVGKLMGNQVRLNINLDKPNATPLEVILHWPE